MDAPSLSSTPGPSGVDEDSITPDSERGGMLSSGTVRGVRMRRMALLLLLNAANLTKFFSKVPPKNL